MTTTSQTISHFRTCNLCEAMCGIEIKVQDGQVVSIAGDRQDSFSRGHICPKAVALQDLHSDPDRLRHPVRRTADGWERISWEEAFDTVATKLREVQMKHGPDAVASYSGNPNVHNYGSIMFGPFLLRSLGTKNKFSATSVDQLPHHLASFLMFGHQLALPIPDIDRTDFFLIMGGNPVVSNGSLMTAPDVANRIKDIRKRGGKVVVVDPRKTETAEIADEHLFIRPGTDAWLLMAMLQVMFAENLEKPGRLLEFTSGLEQIRELVTAFTPEAVAGVTGIPAERIRTLARAFAGAKTAVCYGRIGLSTQEFGGLCQWLVNLVNLVTGNLDAPGGSMFTLPAFDTVGISGRTGQRGSFARRRTRVRNLPEFGGEFPVAALAEEILTPGPGQIRALVSSAGNPVLSTPNGGQLEQALENLDFMVSIDVYVNETTRHAHIILPPTGPLEHENYDVVFHVLAIRNTAKYTPALFEPAPDTRHDWEIFLELFRRLAGDQLPPREKKRITKWLAKHKGPEGVLDWAFRSGPYGGRFKQSATGLTLGKLKNAPHGIDLGPLVPCLPKRLFTPSKRIEAAPEPFVADVERLRLRLQEWSASTNGDFDLLLIGRRQLRSNNSWMHNSFRLVKGKDRCTLLIHPEDAVKRQLTQGQTVRVASRVGTIQTKIDITAEMMPGVVSLPHGWGHTRPGIKLQTAQEFAGVSLNDLTDHAAVDTLSGNAALCGVPVRIEN
ncbi:MAG: molybdopterin oxidoreductase family protein [Blastocatellia bacterium]|nr:molybdopterin oxidoreductase family protein [Blastocatellia bacterium]